MRMRVLGTLITATAAAVAGTAVPAYAAEGTVLGADAPGAIPGRYIVTMKGTGAGVSAQSTEETTYTKSMTAVQARHLAADPDVRFVEQDRVVHMEATQINPPSWGLD